MATIQSVINVLNEWAPPGYQEGYDNSKLIVGDPKETVTKVIVSLDCTEDVVEEAIKEGANLIVSHHPIVFSGLKSLTGKNYIERTVIKAIKNNIALFAIHTNLDNVSTGVNAKIAELIGLKNVRILQPLSGDVLKLRTYVPLEAIEQVKEALFKAGAGGIGNYEECSFTFSGEGTFRGNDISNPVIGEKGIRESVKEGAIEVVLEKHLKGKVLSALFSAHPYEEVAYDLWKLENVNQTVGAGMIGDLDSPEASDAFLKRMKVVFKAGVVKHTALHKPQISKVALCGGSGSFLLGQAIGQKADVFITGDFKYHQFFDAENKIVIADIGHYESEQFTIDLIAEKLQEKFPNFAILKTQVNTNPIQYL